MCNLNKIYDILENFKKWLYDMAWVYAIKIIQSIIENCELEETHFLESENDIE